MLGLVSTATAFAQEPQAEAQPADPFVEEDAPPPPPSDYPDQTAQTQPPPPPVVQAQPQPQPVVIPVDESRHKGFFLRFILGGNFLGMRTDFGGSNITIRGAGAYGNFSIGGSLIERLAIHFDVYVATAISPSVDFGGMIGAGSADSLVLISAGGGLTYYLRNNMYFSIGVGFGGAALASDTSSGVGSTEGGVTSRFLIGKEWWMGPEWGIGLVGILGFAYLPDGPANWSTGHIGLGLSITKN